jgi:hypothetical protein
MPQYSVTVRSDGFSAQIGPTLALRSRSVVKVGKEPESDTALRICVRQIWSLKFQLDAGRPISHKA